VTDRFRFIRRRRLAQVAAVGSLTTAAIVAEAVGLALLSVLLNIWVGSAAVPQAGLLARLQEPVRANPVLFFLLLGFTYVGKSALSLWANYASISLALAIVDEWRHRLFAALLRVPARAVPPKQGALVQLVLDEPSVAGGGLSAAGILIQNAASALAVYLTLFWISPRITLALTAISLLAGLVLMALSRYARITAEQRSHAYAEGYGYLTEMLGALKQVRIFGLEGTVEQRSHHFLTRMRTANRRGSVIASSPRIVIELVFFGSAMLMLASLSAQLGDPAVLSGIALAIVAAIRLLPALSATAGTWVQVQQALPAVRRIRSELRSLESAAEVSDHASVPVQTIERGIDCRGISFAYPSRPPALRGIDLRIDVGTFVGIVGPSGSGKSTLIDLLCGLHEPDGGVIIVDGRDLRTLSKPDWRSLLGIVPQDGFLLSGTLRENLCLLRPSCSEQLLVEALKVTGADRLVAELPAGLDTVIGERGISLSGGQRQRVALTRVLLREPRILILDEATSALDPESDKAVYAALERYRGTMTIIAITHRLSSIRRADRIHVIDDGKRVESGDHDMLMRLNGVYAAMHRAAEPHAVTATA
jgi:ABC-type multidrug transport system fused ATPase/permease subunit